MLWHSLLEDLLPLKIWVWLLVWGQIWLKPIVRFLQFQHQFRRLRLILEKPTLGIGNLHFYSFLTIPFSCDNVQNSLVVLLLCFDYWTKRIYNKFLCPSSSDTSAQPTPSTTPVISSSSDTAAEDQQNDSGSSSSNEWGACRLRTRRSTSRINPLPVGKPTSLRQTRSNDSAIQSPPPLPTTPTSSTPTAPPANDLSNVSIKEESPCSENDDVARPGAVSLNLTCIIGRIFKHLSHVVDQTKVGVDDGNVGWGSHREENV